ncbi:DUF6973 domain-containing protein [Zunongwangia atlantica]|uniref:DUF6973 domain-containing protein n=1 Tax=Zunongwangia atlantica 22II14-10F7 TaxID=1185767 RepID=A0A1Y1T3I0_9FLAO|nr:hypothetical protein [Zunongwangia atlantica]ORL45144.1 hypothetical protein IIF7_11852 [Zunongwangia atlantica 22II14-10F7]
MAIGARIRQLNFKEIFILLKLFLPQPFYIFPTYRATRETLKLCDRLFGKKHYQDNRENAFRHAYWNFLIAEKVFQKNNSVEESIIWAKKITDLHERMAPNKALARAMDLHNNDVGRNIFSNNPKENAVERLQDLMISAVKITEPELSKFDKNQLVFIEE